MVLGWEILCYVYFTTTFLKGRGRKIQDTEKWRMQKIGVLSITLLVFSKEKTSRHCGSGSWYLGTALFIFLVFIYLAALGLSYTI